MNLELAAASQRLLSSCYWGHNEKGAEFIFNFLKISQVKSLETCSTDSGGGGGGGGRPEQEQSYNSSSSSFLMSIKRFYKRWFERFYSLPLFLLYHIC